VVDSKKKRVSNLIRDKGILWTASYIFNKQIKEKISDKYALWKNKKESGTKAGKSFVDLPSHTVEENKRLWNNYDWSEEGEEWTSEVQKYKGIDPDQWKQQLISNLMVKNFPVGKTILEIGPGAGRWTEHLQKIGKRIILADITKKCLDVCQERFKDDKNIEYNLIENDLDFLPENCIDQIWSYDVFVHINPSDIRKYVKEFQRVLKPGGIAIIHHSGMISDYIDKKEGWRSFMGKNQFSEILEGNNLKIISQDENLVHLKGDIITIFTK